MSLLLLLCTEYQYGDETAGGRGRVEEGGWKKERGKPKGSSNLLSGSYCSIGRRNAANFSASSLGNPYVLAIKEERKRRKDEEGTYN